MSNDKETKTLNTVYGMLIALTVLSFVPNMTLATIVLLAFIVYLIALYVIKSKAEDDGLLENHCAFLIKTIWVTSLFSLLTLTAALIYLLPIYDPSALNSCNANLFNALTTNPNVGMADLQTMLQPCMDQFMSDNNTVFMTAALIAGGPIVIYFIYRLYKGGSRAFKGYRVANPKAWF